jgi:ADP-ribose pyrophosphatase YjhB (NUDIX family)
LDHGFIERKENGYCISKRGEKLMADIDLKGNRYDLFRFSITVNAIKYIDGKKYILVQKRNRHPYFGDTNTIAGKVKKGESVKDAAIRKLKEEAGLDVEDVKVLGVLRKVRFDQEGNFLEDVVYTTCYCENPTGLINDENEWSKNWWCEINEFLEIMKNNIDYGKYDREVILRIRDGNFNNFYFEQFEKVRDY